MIDRLEGMLAAGKDSALLRYGLGLEYLKAGDPVRAIEHLERSLDSDRDLSATWKVYGNALRDAGELRRAIDAYRTGIAIAGRKGDRQAEKEMGVFLRRAEKALARDG